METNMIVALLGFVCLGVGHEDGADVLLASSPKYPIVSSHPVLNMTYKLQASPAPAELHDSGNILYPSNYVTVLRYVNDVHLPCVCSLLVLVVICLGIIPWSKREHARDVKQAKEESRTDVKVIKSDAGSSFV